LIQQSKPEMMNVLNEKHLKTNYHKQTNPTEPSFKKSKLLSKCENKKAYTKDTDKQSHKTTSIA